MRYSGTNGVPVENWLGQTLGDIHLGNVETFGWGAVGSAVSLVDWSQPWFEYSPDDEARFRTRLPEAGHAVRRLNRDGRVLDRARDSQPDLVLGYLVVQCKRDTWLSDPQRPAPPACSGALYLDGSRRQASFRALVDVARAHTSYTSRAVARRAVRLRPADRFVEIGSRVYVREHGFDHHTCGARPGTATLAGSSTPVAPPRAA